MEFIPKSTLILKLQYDKENEELTIFFVEKYFEKSLTYCNVEKKYFEAFCNAPSCGQFYLQIFKQFFKTKKTKNMADRPKTVNQASDEVRFIDFSIDVSLINKDWLVLGKKVNEKTGKPGLFLNGRLRMLPDGEVDKYGNLGMITQKVPSEIYKADKEARGSILGNAAEFEKKPFEQSSPGSVVGDAPSSDILDDLPF